MQNISLNGSDLGTTVNTNTQNIAGLSSSKADKSELFSGNYNDLTNKPTLFSGNYNDLTNKPTIPDISGYLKVTGENTASYCKLSNGLIFQWGSAVLDQNNNATKNIVLQTPFANSSYGVVASHGTGNISNDYLNSFKITARSKTYFTVKKHFSESSEYIWWIAIGY